MISPQTVSPSARSIILLDRIHALDAQSLYVVLKLFRRIAVRARLAVIVILEDHAERVGLLDLMDNLLVFSWEVRGTVD